MTRSGSMTLDVALGGGYPKGRVIEIYGPESSGKTTLALHALAEVQKSGGIIPCISTQLPEKGVSHLWTDTLCIGTAAFIDAEHALDPEYARKLGVNTDDLLICQVTLVSMSIVNK